MASPRRDTVVETLRQRFLSASHLGMLRAGDKLPSARDVARELGVDRRVVLAAYRALEREGIIELRQRSGIYFAPAAARPGASDPRRTEWMTDLVTTALTHGVATHALAEEIHRSLGTLRLRAACIECNDDQIAGLCAELQSVYGLESSGVEVDPLRDLTSRLTGDGARAPGEGPGEGPGEMPAELRRADLLITTTFHASDVRTVAESLGTPWIAVSLRADVFAEIARLLEQGPAYAVVADPRFAHKLRLIYHATRGQHQFHGLVAGQDDLGGIPAGAPTYVTRLAQQRLAPGLAHGHEILEPRAFAATSARELVAFIVRTNDAARAAHAER